MGQQHEALVVLANLLNKENYRISVLRLALASATQQVGHHVELICDVFSADAQSPNFNPGHAGEPDPRCLAPELQFV